MEKIHYDKNSLNVFLLRLADKVPVTRAKHGGMSWEKYPDETQDEFEGRAIKEAQKLPCDSAVNVFDLWLSVDP